MSKLNSTVRPGEKMRSKSHLNHMGGLSYDFSDPFFRLRMVAASSFFGEPKYYREDGSTPIPLSVFKDMDKPIFDSEYNHCLKVLGGTDMSFVKGMNPSAIMEKIIDECLDTDVEKTLMVASQLRKRDYIRSAPQVILIRAAMHPSQKGSGLVRTYGKEICIRGDEPANGLSYFFSRYGTKTAIPNSLKRLWKDVLSSLDEYSISKYRMEKNFVKTVDVVNLVHANSEAINKLVKGKSRQKKTWETILSNGDNSTKENKAKNWDKAIPSMGHMALLRNLRNFSHSGVDFNAYKDLLLNGVKGGKQLPFRYYSAFKALENAGSSGDILDLVEKCLEESYDSSIHFKGNTVCLSDNSGSARGATTSELGTMSINVIGNLSSVITCKMSDSGTIGVFGNELRLIPVRKNSSTMDILEKVNNQGEKVGGETENGIWLFWEKSIREKIHWDNIFVYSDMQAGRGGLYGLGTEKYPIFPGKSISSSSRKYIDVPGLISTYRKEVNPNVMVYLVQTAGYEDTIVPEYFDRTFFIGGWSQNILSFANEINNIFNQ